MTSDGAPEISGLKNLPKFRLNNLNAYFVKPELISHGECIECPFNRKFATREKSGLTELVTGTDTMCTGPLHRRGFDVHSGLTVNKSLGVNLFVPEGQTAKPLCSSAARIDNL